MKPGDKLKLKSNAYDCLREGEICEVKLHEDGSTMYVKCKAGRHYLYQNDVLDFEEVT